MKRLLLLSAVLVFAASLAFAQAGSVILAADPGGTNCNYFDNVPGLGILYVVLVNSPGTTAAQFAAPQPPCYLGTYLADGPVHPVTLGTSQTGVAVAWGGCLPSPVHVLTIQFFNSAITGPCCYYPVVPDPNAPSGQIEVVDCVNQLHFVPGGEAIVNPNATCNCTIPTQDSTWGGIKSLYAD